MAARKALTKAVGKLMLGRLPGFELDEASRKNLADGIIGGAVLFKENGRDLDQLIKLCDDIINTSDHNAIIAVDEEGGAVQRFDNILTSLPSPMAVAANCDPEVVKELSGTIARQLHAIGFNCLLSPCLDVLTNAVNQVIATRAFSDNPARVGELARHAIEAISRAGIVAVGKHFPGHGSTIEDSHLGLAENKMEIKSLWQIDLVPYRQCLDILPAIMLGHIWLSSVDETQLPSTLSSRVTQGILRGYLGFKGVIMTDDLIMKSITDTWGLAEAAVLALEAGSDLLLTCGEAGEMANVNAHIVKAIESGRLSEERIKDSIQRIEKCFPILKSETLDCERKQLKKMINDGKAPSLAASVKAVSALRGTVPEVSSGNWLVLVPNHARYSMKLAQHLRDCLKKNKFAKKDKYLNLQFTEIRYSVDPSPEEAKQIASECAERNCIFLTYRSLSNQGQILLGALVAENARETVAVCTDVPFDLLGLPRFENCLATFDPSDQAMQALAIVILGGEGAKGECPVSLEFQLASGPYT
jgi:beta-N-acetylhexosaminidase